MNYKEKNLFTQLRDSKDLTQRELSEKTGISNSYLAELENGDKNNPSLKIIKKLEVILGPEIRNFFLS